MPKNMKHSLERVRIVNKLNCNLESIQNSVLPNLENSVSLLSKSFTNLNNSFIPNSYYDKGNLESTIEDIRYVNKEIVKLIDFINTSDKKLKAIKDENSASVDRIQEIVVKNRVKIVKNS